MSSAIERALRDVSARRLRTHKLAKTELLHLADQLENVPAIVNSGSLATAVLFMAQSKDYYRYIGVEILIRIIESGDGLEQVSPQKDFFYHTLVDMIDNYTSQQHAPDAAPDDLLQRKIADRVAVMRRTADRLRKLKEPADSLDAAAASAAAADSSASPLLPSSPVKASLGKKTRRTTAPIVVAAMTGLRNSPLSLSARAAFDAKVANLEDDDVAADAASAAAAQEAVASVVQALSPRGPRGSSKRAPRSSAADDGAPSAPSHEVVDFEVPPPPPLPDSLRRGTVLPDDDAGDAELPPPLPDSALLPGTLAPPPPLPLPDVADGDDVDQFTLPRLKSSQPSRSASAETDVTVLRKAVSLRTKKKRAGTEMLRSSPPRDGAVAAVAAADTDVKRSTSPPVARPTSVAPPPPRAKSSSSVRVEVAAAHAAAAAAAAAAGTGAASGGDANAEELRQLKMRLMLAAGSMGTAQQALTSDDSWANQMALAKAQADYKSLQNKIAEVQQRAGSSAVVTTPISGGTVRAVKLTSTSRFSVRERTASIDAGTGQIADVKTPEEKGREERLLELIGSIAPSGAATADAGAGAVAGAAAAGASETAERSSETNGADSSLSRSESSTPSNSTRSPAPAEAQFVRGSFHSELTSSGRSLADADTADELGLTKPRPASSDGADARLLTDARQLKRMYAAQEILETEVRYVRCLESVVDNYKRELERSASTSAAAPSGPQSLASPAQIRTLFSNAQAILNTNRVLLNQVRARVGQWDAHSRLGDVFLRIADFFKIYIEYANNYDAAHEQFDQLIDSSEAFVRFCEAMELRDGLDLGLEDLLIMPVQRLPRYVMLLESLLKYTPAVHPDRDALQQAATKIQEISQQINDTNREVEQRRRVFEIQQSLALAPGQPGIVAPHRIFQRDAQAVYYDHETSRRRRVHVYLFNDLVLLTSAAARPASVVATCSLRTARTARISDQKGVRDGDDITNAMVLIDMSGTNPQQAASGGRHQHVLCWATPEERDAWLAAVDEAKAETIHAMISKNQMV